MIQYPEVQITGVPATTMISAYPDTQTIVIYNESQYFMQVTLNGSGTYGLAAYTADAFQVFPGFTGTINFNPLQYIAINTGTTLPASVVFIQAFGEFEPITRLIKTNSSTGYPISLNRLQSIGNAVSTTQATSIVNVSNPNGTPIVSASTQPTTIDPLVAMFNNGGLILGGTTIGDPSGQLQINLETVLGSATPPTGTGNVTVYQIFGAATPYTQVATISYKRLLIVYSNLKNTSASKYTIALPTVMKCTVGWFVHTTDSAALEFLSGGTAQGFNVATGFGVFGVQTSIGSFTWGSGLGAFDTLRFGASDAITHNGFTILEYI